MSIFNMFVLFIIAFCKTVRETFFNDVLKVLDDENEEVKKGVYSKEYLSGLIRLVSFLRIDPKLTTYELSQISFNLHITKASTAYAWLVEYDKVIDHYINNPLLRGTEDVYIPSTLTKFYVKSRDTTLLDFLSESHGVCALVPYLKDMNALFENIYQKIDTIEDEIMRDYYRNKLRYSVSEVNDVARKTIEWAITYDRSEQSINQY